MKIKGFMKKILICTMLLTLGSSTCVFAESRSVDPQKVEIPVEEVPSDFDGELDPTTITNMQEFLPQDSQITSLNKVPNGDGSVIESETSGETKTPEGKEFYVIQTSDEQVFYLVIDHAKSSDNVYFLNQINASDLILEETNSNNSSSSSSKEVNKTKELETEETTAEETTTEVEVKKENEVEESTKDSGNIFLFVIIIAGVLGVGYYQKIYKPKKKVLDDALDFENDFEGMNSDTDDDFEEDIEEDLEEDELTVNTRKTSQVHVKLEGKPKVKSRKAEQVQEEYEEVEDEWEEPTTKPRKQKKINNERQMTVNRNEQPQRTKGLNVLSMLGKFVFGSILLCLVSLGLTVLTNESLRNMIMETVKNYF